MKRLIAAVCAAMLLAVPVSAAEDTAGYIDDIVAETTLDNIADSRAELYAIAIDQTVSPECRRYADINLAGFVLIEATADQPESWALEVLFDFVLEALPTFQNDCKLAI